MPINTEIGVTTNTVISLALDNQVQMEVTPKSTGATSYASTKLAVSTNSSDGYAIYMQTGSESGSLTGVTSNLDGEISNTTKNNVVLDELETNAYGYALSQTEVDGNTTYSHVPTTSTVVKTTSYVGETSGEYAYGDTYYLAFGTKVGTNLPAGQYAGTVTVSAVANPTTLRSMYDLTYMQDMTSDICESTKEHYTKQLIDTRDGKSYWVAKLKDGNCWMVQNLALDMTSERVLTAADTNLPQGTTWGTTKSSTTTTDGLASCRHTGLLMGDLESVGNNVAINCFVSGGKAHYVATVTEEIATSNVGNLEPTQTRSWDFGEAVLLAPLSNEVCTTNKVGENWVALLRGQNWSDVACAQVVPVDDEWKPTFMAREDTVVREDYVRKTQDDSVIWIPRSKAEMEDADKDSDGNYIPYSYTGLLTADIEAKTYDAHYLIGNYYQWNTATAGTGGALVSSNVNTLAGLVDAAGSICPKGWGLPEGSGVAEAVSGQNEVYQLLKSYGWEGAISSSDPNVRTGSSIIDGREVVKVSPLYYFNFGFIDMGDAWVKSVGIIGTSWTSTPMANTSGALYNQIAKENFTTSVYYFRRYEGRSVRCIAQ